MEATMRNLHRSAAVLIMSTLFCATATCGGGTAPAAAQTVVLLDGKLILHPANGVPGVYVVVLQDSVADVAGTATALTARYGGVLLNVFTLTFRGFALKIDDVDAPDLAIEPDVKVVEQDVFVHGDRAR